MFDFARVSHLWEELGPLTLSRGDVSQPKDADVGPAFDWTQFLTRCGNWFSVNWGDGVKSERASLSLWPLYWTP